MKVYTIEEDNYNNLTEIVDKISEVAYCAKKVIKDMESSMNYRSPRWRDEEDEEDYDWKIKKGRHPRY